MKTIKRCTLTGIDQYGAQEYTCEDGDVHFLCGWDRAQNVSVGATGYLEYRTGPSYGLYFFVPDKVPEPTTY